MREDWIEVELDEVAKYLNGRAFKPIEWEKNGLPIIRIQNLNKPRAPYNYSNQIFENKYLVKKNDLLFAWSASLGAYIWKGDDAWLNQHIFKVVECKNVIEKIFLYYFFCKITAELYAKAHGSGMVHVTKKKFVETKIYLPSLPEQRAIVTKIEHLFSALDKGISDLKKAQAQLKIYRQAVLKKAFEGELTKAWREQQIDLPTADELLTQIKIEREQHYQQKLADWQNALEAWEAKGKEGKKPKKPGKRKELEPLNREETKDFFSIPKKWKFEKLGTITLKISDGPFGSNLKTADYATSGIRVIRLENIGNLEFFDSKYTFVSKEKYETIKRHSVFPNDVIFSSFIANQINVVSIPEHVKLAINKADCFCVRFGKMFNFKYAEYFLSTRYTYNQLINLVHGATRPRINTTQLKEVIIPVCSLQEQHQIIQEIESRLSVCDKAEESIVFSLKKAEALRQSILKKAFEGKLLTPEELAACRAAPDWAPAADLLERIRKEKAAEVPKKKTRKKK